jgi:hypothetical protein
MNMYVGKKWVLMFLIGVIPSIIFIMCIFSGLGLVYSMMLVFISALFMVFLASKMLRHPLTGLIEGKGMLTLTLDSTGFIESFLVSAEKQPFVRGIFKGKQVETMFDRDITQYLIPPQETRLVDATMINSQGKAVGTRKVMLMPTPEEKADYLFAFGSYPTFIYNKVLGTFLQKSLFSNFEQHTFVRHAVMYLLKKTEELSASVRDFARYIVEQIKPHKSFWEGKKWILYLLLIAAVIIFILLFLPSILSTLGSGGISLPSVEGGGAVKP